MKGFFSSSTSSCSPLAPLFFLFWLSPFSKGFKAALWVRMRKISMQCCCQNLMMDVDDYLLSLPRLFASHAFWNSGQLTCFFFLLSGMLYFRSPKKSCEMTSIRILCALLQPLPLRPHIPFMVELDFRPFGSCSG